jgi:hypothetical protein
MAVDPDDHVIMVAAYLAAVDCGGFLDDDGFGEIARDGLVAQAAPGKRGWPGWVRPSDRERCIPEDATHVVWYNR